MMSSKQIVLALSFTCGLSMLHTPLDPIAHGLAVETRGATHTEAMFEQGARQDDISDTNARRVQAANQWIARERARIAALRADLVAQHTAAVANITPARTELHGRMAASGLFTALPPADVAAVAGAAPAGIAGRPASLAQRHTAVERMETAQHNRDLAALDRELVEVNAEFAALLEEYAQEERLQLEECRAREEGLDHEQLVFNNNHAQRLIRWQAEQARLAANAAATAHTTSLAAQQTARAARRAAAITGAGGR